MINVANIHKLKSLQNKFVFQYTTIVRPWALRVAIDPNGWDAPTFKLNTLGWLSRHGS
ncbi:hypothetical protein LPE01_28280 [Lactiplantibacillus pentosus]|nr:hypothetical protein LPE01_28280 [Lactiplantibacillus pentosus]